MALVAQVVNPDEIVSNIVDEFGQLDARDWVVAGAVLLVALLLARVAGRAVRRSMGEGTLGSVTIARVVRGGIVVVGFALALWIVGVQLGPIVFFLLSIAFLMAVSFGIAVADYIAGIVLVAKRPFELGDLVAIAGHRGLVTDHDFRAITLRTVDKETITIPNRLAIGSVIVNATPGGDWRTKVSVSVAYGSDLREAAGVVKAAVAQIEGVLGSPPPDVRFSGFGPSSVDLDVIVHHAASVESLELVRHEVVITVHDALTDAGFVIPFPQRDVWLRGGNDA